MHVLAGTTAVVVDVDVEVDVEVDDEDDEGDDEDEEVVGASVVVVDVEDVVSQGVVVVVASTGTMSQCDCPR